LPRMCKPLGSIPSTTETKPSMLISHPVRLIPSLCLTLILEWTHKVKALANLLPPLREMHMVTVTFLL
jgi:hypothetical protein